MPNRERRECLYCKELFLPQRGNWWHQKFCSKPECRRASKAHSQRRWLAKPENRDQFRGSANVERVRQWREKNPGYWKRPAKTAGTLQEVVPPHPPENKEVPEKISSPPLQDLVASQDPLLLGLIAHLTDSPLQETVEQTTYRLLKKGQDFLDMRSRKKTEGTTDADKETCPMRGASAPSPSPIQLGGPAPGTPAIGRSM